MDATHSSDEKEADPVISDSDADEGAEDDATMTLRCIVSGKEAGIIIGHTGSTIAEIRAKTNTRAGVSRSIDGVNERILSINGTPVEISRAVYYVCETIMHSIPEIPTLTLRMLVSHSLVGNIIGKGGSKIKQMQSLTGAYIAVSKISLSPSTERIIEVTGSSPSKIEAGAREVLTIVHNALKPPHVPVNTVFYIPGTGAIDMEPLYSGFSHASAGAYSSSAMYPIASQRMHGNGYGDGHIGGHSAILEQKISIPSDMVGCIIGRGGSKINEIRRLSGSRINISKESNTPSGERLFIISGSQENNERALYLLYNQLESEKERRSSGKRRKFSSSRPNMKRGNSSDIESDSESMVDVDFEWFDLDESKDFEPIKNLLAQLFSLDAVDFNLSDFADLILKDSISGNTIKSSEDEMLSFLALVPYTKQAVLKSFLDYVATRAGNEALKEMIQNDKNKIGVVFSSRFVNMPIQVVPPSYRMLVEEAGGQNKFDYVVFVSRVFLDEDGDDDGNVSLMSEEKKTTKKTKTSEKKGSNEFPYHMEDTFLIGKAVTSAIYPYKRQQPRQEEDFGVPTKGSVFALQGKKFGPKLVDELESFLLQ